MNELEDQCKTCLIVIGATSLAFLIGLFWWSFQ
jgi:hypothetical protein